MILAESFPKTSWSVPANRTQMKTGDRFGVDLMPGRVIAIGDESLAASVETVRREYASRRTRHAARARRFRDGATLISRSKRFVTYSIIGYVVFDPTVGAVLVPLFLGLLPVTLLQSLCVRRWLSAMSRATFYASGIRRLDDRWQGRGETGQRYLDLSHEYAADLDLFGRGSLYELLCTARTQAGQDVLARWLLNPADRPTIIERQQAIKELRDQVDLREAVATVNVISQHSGIKGLEDASTGGKFSRRDADGCWPRFGSLLSSSGLSAQQQWAVNGGAYWQLD